MSRERSASKISLALNKIQVKKLVRFWLEEDCPSLDFASCALDESCTETAVLICKSSRAILCGIPFFEAVFDALDCSCQWLDDVREGQEVQLHQRIAKIRGPVHNILRGERVALNCLSRASGISTEANRLVDHVRHAGWKGRVAGTRKTTPGFRLVEKYALHVGGADGHRHDLTTMVMIKDNHIWSSGNVFQAVSRCKEVGGFSLKYEVECRSLKEARDAALAGCDVIMFDNFNPQTLRTMAATFKEEFPNVLVEVSGGIDLSNILDYIGPNVDIVSTSKLTQGYKTVDFSLKLLKDGHDPENPLVDMAD